MIMDRLYGGVCYAGIDTDPELKYPKGAGRVAFSNQQSYIAAISARFVQLQHGEIDKRVSCVIFAQNFRFILLFFRTRFSHSYGAGLSMKFSGLDTYRALVIDLGLYPGLLFSNL